ncbi:MAG TPA: hypothetical protein VGD17_07070 [Chitinophagaceae bacterium]
MNRRVSIIVAVLLVAAAIAVYAWREFNRKNESLAGIKPAYEVDATFLISEFNANDTVADSKYLGQVVAVHGMVKQVEKDEEGNYTIVMGDTMDMSSVRCAMDSTQAGKASSLKRGENVKVKGSFTGFEKDDTGLLGSDVKLNRGVIVNADNR